MLTFEHIETTTDAHAPAEATLSEDQIRQFLSGAVQWKCCPACSSERMGFVCDYTLSRARSRRELVYSELAVEMETGTYALYEPVILTYCLNCGLSHSFVMAIASKWLERQGCGPSN